MVTFIGTLAAIPVIATRIPENYFVGDPRRPWGWSRRHPLLYLFYLGAKNAAGLLFLTVGAVMIFIPGQGLITMVLGLMFLNFPGKRRLEKKLIRRPAVHRPVNWMRGRMGRPPLQIPPAEG